MNLKEYNFEEGELILIDKPTNWTSFDVVNKLRYATRAKKVGHAGTLDPLATGLLIICTGKYTKSINNYQKLDKEYIGTFRLGQTTPSYDAELEPDAEFPTNHITPELIQKATFAFLGQQMQLPPIYSAIKKDGKKSYEEARKGKEVILDPRPIRIDEFEITGIEMPVVHFRVKCSTGTYIRSLAYDFGKALGSGAFLSNLRRTQIGDFNVSNAHKIEVFISTLPQKFK